MNIETQLRDYRQTSGYNWRAQAFFRAIVPNNSRRSIIANASALLTPPLIWFLKLSAVILIIYGGNQLQLHLDENFSKKPGSELLFLLLHAISMVLLFSSIYVVLTVIFGLLSFWTFIKQRIQERQTTRPSV